MYIKDPALTKRILLLSAVAAPGQHASMIWKELGYDDAETGQLKLAGVIA
ncbi:hypothetical protein ACPPVU_15560 [Mucilaginibacter sp. McL0603]